MRRGQGEDAQLGNDLVRVPFHFTGPDPGAGDQVPAGQAPADRQVEELALPRRWLERELGLHPARLVLVTARGDSMEPTISDGDLLLVDTGQTRPGPDGIYVIRRDTGVAIKRLELRPDGSITIRSDNAAYSEYTLPRDQAAALSIVGRVVWAGGKI